MTFQVGDLVEFEVGGARDVGVVTDKPGVSMPNSGYLYVRSSLGEGYLLSGGLLRSVRHDFVSRLSGSRLKSLLRSLLAVQLQKTIRRHGKGKAYPPWGYDWNGDNYGDNYEGDKAPATPSWVSVDNTNRIWEMNEKVLHVYRNLLNDLEKPFYKNWPGLEP